VRLDRSTGSRSETCVQKVLELALDDVARARPGPLIRDGAETHAMSRPAPVSDFGELVGSLAELGRGERQADDVL